MWEFESKDDVPPSTIRLASSHVHAHVLLKHDASWLYYSSPDVQPVTSCAPVWPPAVCLYLYSRCPLTFIFVLSVAVPQSVPDSMLTTLQKAPKKRLGLAVSFPISLRRIRSWTQLMANNYQGNFPMTDSGDFVRGKEGAARCGVPLQTNTSQSAPLPSDFFFLID